VKGRIAIISDVHGYIEALNSILEDIQIRNHLIKIGKKSGGPIEQIMFLGDAVGYGADPVECLTTIQNVCEKKYILAGNLEIATCLKIESPHFGLTRENGIGGKGAWEGIHWTIRQMYGDSTPIQSDKEQAEQYTQSLVHRVRADDFAQESRRQIVAEITAKIPPVKSGMLSRTVEVPHEAINKAFDTQLQRKIQEYLHETAAVYRGEKIFGFMKSLPKSARFENALLVHDNELDPGDSKYVGSPGIGLMAV